MLERMLAGVSTRRCARTGEPVGEEIDEVARSTSKSAVSREFVSRTREDLIEPMSRPLGDLRLAVLLLDGIELKGRCCVVALGLDTDGVKHPLGLWDGSSENATVATTLLANLVERGLNIEQDVLVVIDGAKALRKPVRGVLSVQTPVQRCVRHKERNVLGHLPSATSPWCAGASGRRGRLTITSARSTSSGSWPTSWPARIRALPCRCARVWMRRSPSPASGCARA
jgi:putative transposase